MRHVFFPPKGTVKIETDIGWNEKGWCEIASNVWVPPARDLFKARVCWNVGKQKKLMPGEVRETSFINGTYEAELKSVYKGVSFFVELGLHSSYKKIVIRTNNDNLAKDLRRCLLGIPMSHECGSSKDLCYDVMALLMAHGVETEFESIPKMNDYTKIVESISKYAQNK